MVMEDLLSSIVRFPVKLWLIALLLIPVISYLTNVSSGIFLLVKLIPKLSPSLITFFVEVIFILVVIPGRFV